MPRGRLLEVGCGHGLLLDEARRRGYNVEGIELSVQAARHAREILGLKVREMALEDLPPDGDRYDALVLIDVLEHLSDPVGALERSCALLAPGGALLMATPDPSSLVARAAGKRWWSYIPAHCCLIPRRTLRELICARGFVVAEDVPYVASFTLRYWLAGLAERGGWAASATAGVAARLPRSVQLTASLRDEHVLLARRVELHTPTRPLARKRRAGQQIHVVIPARNASATIAHEVARNSADSFDRVLLVDDASSDDTASVALETGLEVLSHPVRSGYGASHKTGYTRALLDGADVVVTIDARSEWDSALVEQLASPIVEGAADAVFGRPYSSRRRAGSRILDLAGQLVSGPGHLRYPTGYKAFSADLLRSIAFLRDSDGSNFDLEVLVQIAARQARSVEIPIPRRYVARSSPRSSMGGGFAACAMLAMLIRVHADRNSRRWLVLRRPAVALTH